MELELDLTLGTSHHPVGFGFKEVLSSKPGTGFDPKEASSFRNFAKYELKDCKSSQTLPLISWDGDDGHDHRRNLPPSCPLNMNAMNEEEEVVGWPPIKSWRKKVLHHHQYGGHDNIDNNRVRARDYHHNNQNNNYNNEIINGGSNSMYVKVKMEGDAIARKINLSHFNSYQALTRFLTNMFFPKCDVQEEEEENGEVYTLTYQDKDGDWLLAGDVPWQTFIDSVQRIELLKNGRERGVAS